MYSPKIREDYIPILYKIAQQKGIPMTHLVNDALNEYLNKLEIYQLQYQKGAQDAKLSEDRIR
jgi:hypothetical protein